MTWIMWMAAGLALTGGIASSEASAHGTKQISGVAAYYSKGYRGATASGARYDPQRFTCAHRTLPLGTRLRITDPKSNRSVVVVVNDRGPFTKDRVLDLSLAAAEALHMVERGLIRVTAAVQ